MVFSVFENWRFGAAGALLHLNCAELPCGSGGCVLTNLQGYAQLPLASSGVFTKDNT